MSSSKNLTRSFQPGTPRTAKESAAALDEQLRLASLGVATRVSEHQTSTGIKDKLAQHTIERLLKRAQELRKQFPNKTREDISNRLMMWVGARKGELLNPSISTPGIVMAFALQSTQPYPC